MVYKVDKIGYNRYIEWGFILIRVTVQIEDDEDESRATVISASFDNFQEIIDTEFLEKARPFNNEEECDDKKKKKKTIGFCGKE